MNGKLQQIILTRLSKNNKGIKCFYLSRTTAQLMAIKNQLKIEQEKEFPCFVLESGKIFLVGSEIDTRLTSKEELQVAEQEKLRASGMAKLSPEEKRALGLE